MNRLRINFLPINLPKNEKDNVIGRSRQTPERTCMGCRTKRQQRELLRLVCTPQGDVFPDASGRAPGRGGYVCFDGTCIRQALTTGKVAATFKQSVKAVSADRLCHSAILLLHTRLGSTLSMAQKAGAAVSGATPLQKALSQGRIRYLVLAEDIASTRAEDYLDWCRQQSIPWLTLFSKAELGQRLGKPQRSAIGLTDVRFGEQLSTTANMLLQLRANSEGPEPSRSPALSSSL